MFETKRFACSMKMLVLCLVGTLVIGIPLGCATSPNGPTSAVQSQSHTAERPGNAMAEGEREFVGTFEEVTAANFVSLDDKTQSPMIPHVVFSAVRDVASNEIYAKLEIQIVQNCKFVSVEHGPKGAELLGQQQYRLRGRLTKQSIPIPILPSSVLLCTYIEKLNGSV